MNPSRQPHPTPAVLPGEDTRQRYATVRRGSTDLAATLSAEDCAVQSMPDASPVKWHLAHTTWFFETFLLARHLTGYRPFDDAFCYLFNSYYDAIGERHPRPERGMLTRPSLDDVLAYRAHVDTHMDTLLARPAVAPDLVALIELGLQHEQQHQELILTDVKHLLSRNPLQPVFRKPWPLATIAPDGRHWHRVPAGLVEIGHAGESF